MWSKAENSLVKELSFADFKSALQYVVRVGSVAEAMNHHPEIELGWGRVKLTLISHSSGGITNKDYELAKKIDALPKG